jgi:hypothetical protein
MTPRILIVVVGFLGSDAMWTCEYKPMFRRNILPPSSGLKKNTDEGSSPMCYDVLHSQFISVPLGAFFSLTEDEAVKN